LRQVCGVEVWLESAVLRYGPICSESRPGGMHDEGLE